jgi:hypothetical protein
VRATNDMSLVATANSARAPADTHARARRFMRPPPEEGGTSFALYFIMRAVHRTSFALYFMCYGARVARWLQAQRRASL